jgi:hypothetical protein
VAATAAALALASAGAAGAKEKPRAEIRALKPEADTFISAAEPRRNFGRMTALRADGSPRATVYLRFRMKKLKGDVRGVTLLLYATAPARASYQVRLVEENDWLERRLTYANAPKLPLRYASSKPVRRGAWSAVDVTSFVDEDDDRVTLAITTRSPLGVVFASRESRRGPRLVLRTDDAESEPPPGP